MAISDSGFIELSIHHHYAPSKESITKHSSDSFRVTSAL